MIQATRLELLEGMVESALVSECLTPSQLAWTLELDVRDVRRALDSLRDQARVDVEHEADVEMWRLV